MNIQQEGIQINKYISNSGFCSRREADKLVEQGRVTINKKLAFLTSRVLENDKVAIDDEVIKVKKTESYTYLAFNKPKGVTSTTDLSDKSNIISFINYPKRIFPIGRLDKDSEGLILLTDDGDIVNKILRTGNNHEKEYVVVVNKQITPDFINRMSKGVPILDTTTLPCKVKQEGNKKFRIILKQGLNRQIRRMCEYLDYEVISLQRVRIINIKLATLPIGKWRKLNNAELSELQKKLSNSTKTDQTYKPEKSEKKFKYFKGKK